MTQPEYEQKKRECWKEFCNESCFCNNYGMTEEAFYSAFDRADSLGKQTETIAQEDIEKAAEAFATPPIGNGGKFTRQQVKELLVKFAQLLPGKQEKDADTSLWSRLTEDEKRKMQCRYHTNECVLRDHRKRTGDKAQSKAVARMKLLESLFGKENLKSENK